MLKSFLVSELDRLVKEFDTLILAFDYQFVKKEWRGKYPYSMVMKYRNKEFSENYENAYMDAVHLFKLYNGPHIFDITRYLIYAWDERDLENVNIYKQEKFSEQTYIDIKKIRKQRDLIQECHDHYAAILPNIDMELDE